MSAAGRTISPVEEVRRPVDLSIRTTQALVAVARQALPLEVTKAAEDEPFRFIGPALIARSTGAVESISLLAPHGRSSDEAVLLRVLTEHVIVFAWLAAEPEPRILLWLKEDARQRMAMHNDWLEGAPPLLAAWPRAWFERFKTVDGVMPNLRTCAQQADEFWLTRLPGALPAEHAETTFLGQYQAMFRGASRSVHPGLMGLQTCIAETPQGTVIDVEAPHAKDIAITAAPAVYALGLYIAAAALGWPEPRDIEAAIAEMAAAAQQE
jgi:hypothetical protein